MCDIITGTLRPVPAVGDLRSEIDRPALVSPAVVAARVVEIRKAEKAWESLVSRERAR